MEKMEKLEGSDILEGVPEVSKAEVKDAKRRHAAALGAAQNYIIQNASTMSLALEYEDGEGDATMQDLMAAVMTARTEDLERFVRSKSIPFEDGYIKVKNPKGGSKNEND